MTTCRKFILQSKLSIEGPVSIRRIPWRGPAREWLQGAGILSGGGQAILVCLFHWEQGWASREGCSKELVSRSGSKIGQECTLGKSQGKGTVIQERAGAGQKCWPLGRES